LLDFRRVVLKSLPGGKRNQVSRGKKRGGRIRSEFISADARKGKEV